MHADRLVGRQGPRGRRPDHREGRAAQMGQAEGGGQLGAWLSCTSKATSMAGEVLSSYSTSASASAEPQSRHQLTGFRPWYR